MDDRSEEEMRIPTQVSRNSNAGNKGLVDLENAAGIRETDARHDDNDQESRKQKAR